MLKIKNRSIKQFIIFFLLIFQSVIEEHIPMFRYFDEIVALYIFISAMIIQLKTGRVGFDKTDRRLIVCVVAYAILGSIGSIIYHYQNTRTSILAFFLSVKWFITYYGIKKLFEYNYYKGIDRLSKKVLKTITYIMFIYQGLYMLHVPGITGFWGWEICAKSVFVLGLLLCNWEKRPSFYICLGMQCILLAMSSRAKGYAAILVFLIVILWVVNKEKKLPIRKIITICVFAIAAVWEKVYYYFVDGLRRGYARVTLFITSFKIGNDYFPIGTGWGTFCSHFAAESYSPVYYLYNINRHPELGIENKLYLTDAYWPAIIAESGWLGFIAVVGVFLFLFLDIQKAYKKNIKMYASGIFLIIYLGITTVEETTFMQPVLLCLAIVLGGIAGTCKRQGYRIKTHNRTLEMEMSDGRFSIGK